MNKEIIQINEPTAVSDEINNSTLSDDNATEISIDNEVALESIDLSLLPNDISEADELILSLPALNFIELSRLQSNVEKELENLVGAMNLLKSLESMKNIDEVNRKVAAENILHEKEFKEDSAHFKEYYPGNLKKLTDIKEAIKKELEKFDGIVKGTKFLTDQMVDTLIKNINKLSSIENKNSRVLKIVNITLAAYQNRTDLSYIEKKAHLEYIISGIKKDLKNHKDKCSKNARKEFLLIFTQDQIDIFEKYMTEIFMGNEDATNAFVYHMAKIIKSEKNTGYYNYIKVLVMNILDITAGTYDLDGGKEEFDKKLHILYSFYK